MKKLLILAIAIGLTSSLGAFGGRAAFTDQDTLTANDFDSGTIDLTLGTTSALVTFTNMKPGDTTGPQSLLLTGAGTLSLDYTMSTTMTTDDGTPLLGDALDLTIWEDVDQDGCVAPSTGDDSAAIYDADLNGGAISGARTLASAATETLCFEVVFPSADTAPQGATADAEFVFDSTQT
jgi:hypothetical protein